MNIFKINLKRWSLIFLALATQTMRPEMVLDETFGDRGKVKIDAIEGIDFQSDGKIITLGFSAASGEAILSRYTTDGFLDTSFGKDGTGIVRPQQPYLIKAMNTKVQMNDTIATAFLGGNFEGEKCPYLDHYHANGSEIRNSNVLLQRIRTWFASYASLVFNTSLIPSNTVIHKIALQSNNKIIVVGLTYTETGQDRGFIARYNPDRTLDTTFGPHGTGMIINHQKRRFDLVTLQPDGKIIVGDSTAPNTRLIRYTSDGILDTTFGLHRDGIWHQRDSFFGSIAAQQDNKLIVVKTRYERERYVSEVLRYNPDTSLDTDFGPNGVGIKSSLASFSLVTVQPDSKIVVMQHDSTGNSFLSRYRALSLQEIEERKLAALAAQEAARLAIEIQALMHIGEDPEQCRICLEEVAIQDLIETECHHLFHPNCMTLWRNSGQVAAQTCPMCRTALPAQNEEDL